MIDADSVLPVTRMPLHPCLDMHDLRSCCVDLAHEDQHMQNFISGTVGYSAKLHSCVKFDGTPQELPVMNLYCTRSYKKTPESTDHVRT